jgi:inosine/xanthosine triphosphatase
MKVIVGSENPVKIAAVEEAFSLYFPEETITIDAVSSQSGVSDQPLTALETKQGAYNRAKNANQHDADYSVGIEGGMDFCTLNGQEHGLETSFVCVYDCKTDAYEIASAHGFPVFPKVLQHIHDGLNLSDAMSEVYGIEEIGKKNGYIGWLSDDKITRESSARDAVLLALSALHKEERL